MNIYYTVFVSIFIVSNGMESLSNEVERASEETNLFKVLSLYYSHHG